MRVVISTTPGRGHVYPVVPLARALVDQGDEVLWLTAAESTGFLERAGFRTAAVGMWEREGLAEVGRRYPEIASMQPAERPVVMFAKLFGAVRAPAAMDQTLAAVQDWAPDLVICEAAEFAGHIAAAKVGVPSMTHAFGSLIPRDRVEAAGAEVAQLWQAMGLQPRPYGGSYDTLYLDIFPASLQPQDRPHVPASQPLRPGSYAAPSDEVLPEGLGGAPLVYVTMGTLFSSDQVLSTIVAGLRSLPVQVLVTVGPQGDPAALGPQPHNVHIAKYVPQDTFLPLCSAVVSHAGSGTFLAALANGLPQLCLPQAADQFLNAAASQRSGTGIALQPGEVTENAVTQAAQRLLDEDDFRMRAGGVRAEIADMPGPGDVARMLRDRIG